MFIKEIISHINSKITETGYFTKVFDLCELKEVGDKTAPKYYCSNGEWKEVFNVDYEKGLTYIRKDGDITIDNGEQVTGCDTPLNVDVKLKLIVALKKVPSEIVDDNYSSDRAALLLLNILQRTNSKELRTVIKARTASILITSYTTDNYEILNSEFKKFDIKDLPSKYSFIMANINVKVLASLNCITSNCLVP